jgi:hypothetical protein
MLHDDDSVAGCVNVELDGVRVTLERASKRRQRILRVFALRAPVGDAFQGLCSLYGDVYLSPRADDRTAAATSCDPSSV